MSRFVITGTDTNIGKTVFAAGLARMLGANYWKPIQAGLDGATESERVCELGVPGERIVPEAYRLTTPCSPHEAAKIDGVTLDPARLAPPMPFESLVVEGAGGVLVPVTPEVLYADLFAEWHLPVILVASTALGTINHSLLSIEALWSRHVPLHGIAFIGDANEETETIICRIGRVRRLGRLPYLASLDAESLEQSFSASFDPQDFA